MSKLNKDTKKRDLRTSTNPLCSKKTTEPKKGEPSITANQAATENLTENLSIMIIVDLENEQVESVEETG